MSTCVQSSGSHESHAKSISGESKTLNIKSFPNYGSEIAITALPIVETNCSDFAEDISNNDTKSVNKSICGNYSCQISSTCMPSSLTSSPSIGSNPQFVEIPFGWRRELIDGQISYYSPTNCCFKSLDEVSKYLQSNGTCKCGLECPLQISKTFNFDSMVTSRPYDVEVAKNSNQNKLCNHKRKIIAFATYKEQQLIAEQFNQNHNQCQNQQKPDNNEDHNSNKELVSTKDPKHSKSEQSAQQDINVQKVVNNVVYHNPNSSQLNVIKYTNDTSIDTVSVIQSNDKSIKLNNSIDKSETIIGRSYCQISPNMTQFGDTLENADIIGCQQTYIEPTVGNDNGNHYSVQMSGDYIPQTSNSICLYGQNDNIDVYSLCDSTQITVQPNDKTSIYLTPQNPANYGQIISYDNQNVNIIQSPQLQAFTTEAYSHPFHSSETVCNSNIASISSYIPIPSANSTNSGGIPFNSSPLGITINPTYHAGLQPPLDSPHCNSQNNISIIPQNTSISPMPPLSVANNVTSVTSSVTDVIPAVGMSQQIINSGTNSNAPQVLQFINSVPLTQITANTVTVLQQNQSSEVSVPAATLIIPQLMSQQEHQVLINHAMSPQSAVFPHIANATGLTALPNAFPNVINITNAISLSQRSAIQELSKPLGRSRRRKDYSRSNRSHPPTVASILKQAADNEKKQKEQQLNDNKQQLLKHKDQNLQTNLESNEAVCDSNTIESSSI